MKTIIIFTALKVAEVGGFISICWAFMKLGKIYIFLLNTPYENMPIWLADFIMGIIITLIIIAVIILLIALGWGMRWFIRKNLELVRGK